MKQILDQLFLLAVLFVAVALSGGFLFYQMNQTVVRVAHTQQILFEQSEIYSNLQDMNLSSRGYVLVGTEAILRPYRVGKEQFPTNFDKLKRLTATNPAQVGNIAALDAAEKQFADVTASLIETRSKDSVPRQMDAMDLIRKALADVVLEENRQLVVSSQEAEFYFNCGLTLAVAQVVLGLVLLTTCRRTISNYTLDDKSKIQKLEQEIEQRKKVEKALKDATSKLGRSNTDLQQFAYVASHDLQEPLRAVTGFLTLIAKKESGHLDSETERWINHAVEGAQRMRGLIHDLLAYARIESRGQDLQKTDCNEALTLAKRDLSVMISETDSEIISDKLPEILGEKRQLSQLFQNLLANAIKFRGETKPIIRITVQRGQGECIFSVIDNGRGFDQEHAERIFVIFQRLQGREEYAGTGIGLAICKKIVERHGGRIWAQSVKGEGATFSFALPTIDESRAEPKT